MTIKKSGKIHTKMCKVTDAMVVEKFINSAKIGIAKYMDIK